MIDKKVTECDRALQGESVCRHSNPRPIECRECRAESQPKPVVTREEFEKHERYVRSYTGHHDPMDAYWAYDFLASRTCVELPSDDEMKFLFGQLRADDVGLMKEVFRQFIKRLKVKPRKPLILRGNCSAAHVWQDLGLTSIDGETFGTYRCVFCGHKLRLGEKKYAERPEVDVLANIEAWERGE